MRDITTARVGSSSEDPVFAPLGAPQAEQLTGQKLPLILPHPQGLNSYVYASDNPITKSDPNGPWDVDPGV